MDSHEKRKKIMPLIDWQDWTANESDVLSCKPKINKETDKVHFAEGVYPWEWIYLITLCEQKKSR